MLGLDVSNISYSYRDNSFSLNNINVFGNVGDVICLLGPSGCGKSTLLKLISGIERSNSGTISINDIVVVNKDIFIPTELRNVGLIFQHPSLFSHKTVLQNILFAIRGLSKAEKMSFALETLKSVDMVSYKDCYPHMLSGGQQQLVTIARAIAQRPRIILLDEPFSNLDTILKRNVRKRVLSLLKERSITALLVTHDPEEALEISDRIYIMRNGTIVQSGTPQEIYYNPKDYEVACFFGEVNDFYATVEQSSINSPLGKIPAKSFKDNEKVVVCVRPESILFNEGSDIKAIIRNIKFFSSMIYININNNNYWMKFPYLWLPKKDEIISISLDLDKVLLFKV